MTTTSHRRRLSKRPRGTAAIPQLLWFLAGALLCLTSSCSAQEEEISTAVSQSRQVHKYALPAFSMVLRVSVEEDAPNEDDDDDDIYLDLEMFQETLEHVTEFHLTDIFQQHPDSFTEEQFIRVQLSSKVRQEINQDGTPPNRKHVPLHAGFSGVVSYSFPSDSVPLTEEVETAITNTLEEALVAENYLLLFRRYLSSGILADIEDVYEIRIGTEQLTVLETSNKPSSGKGSGSDGSNSSSSSSNSSTNINAITIVAIVVFLTLSCMLMLFGATVVLVMKDRAKQEETLNGQTMTSIGMGTKKKKAGGEEGEEEDGTEDDEDTTATVTPAWKKVVLPVLRKAITVRRYWRKQIRKQRKARRKNEKAATADPAHAATSSESDDSSNAAEPDDDDGLNDEDVYYDDALSDEEAANQWLDAWQASITSIPVRSVRSSSGNAVNNFGSPNKKRMKKKKTSKSQMAPRPATRQSKNAFLCCIAEEDSVVDGSVMDPNDLELGDSIRSSATAASGRHARSSSQQRELDRIQELTSVVMEEDYPTTSFGGSARKKKRQIQPMEVVAANNVVPDLSTPFSEEEEDSGPVQDIDLS